MPPTDEELIALVEQLGADLYEVLQVHPKADREVVQAAYRRLQQRDHPDKNSGSEERSKRINLAYDILSSVTKRAQYDRLRAGLFDREDRGAGGSSHSAGSHQRSGGQHTGFEERGTRASPSADPAFYVVKGYTVGADLDCREIQLSNVDMSGLSLSGIDLSGAVLEGVSELGGCQFKPR